MSTNIGTLVGATIRPIDSSDLISTAWDNEIKGGHHAYATLSERNSIIIQRRSWGMLCTIYNDGSNNGTYQLRYGYSSTTITDNNNWVAFSGSGGSGGGSDYWLDPALSVRTVEPISPTNGDRYITGLDSSASLTGTNWSTYTGGYIVQWNSTLSDWDKTSPKNGYTIRVNNEDGSLYRYEGTYSTGKWVKEYIDQVLSLTAITLNGYNYTSSLPNLFSYENNQVYLTSFSTTNSGTSSVTLNINGLGAKSVKKQTSNGLDDLLVNELNTGLVYTLFYDGTYFRVNKPFSDAPFDIKYRIRSNELVQVPAYNEYLIYGDLTVEGRLDIDTYGKVVIINGGLQLNGGTVSNSSNIQMVDISGGLTKYNTVISMSSGVTYSVTHGLNTPSIIVNTWDDDTGELVLIDVVKKQSDPNNSIDVNSVTTLSNVRIVIIG